jgi:preprotein translocase subunit SecF
MRIIKDTNINFIGKRRIAVTISIILILIGIVSLISHGGPKYGIDFTGGTSLKLMFENPVNVGQVRAILSGIGLGNSEIKEFATGMNYSYDCSSKMISKLSLSRLSTKLRQS